MVATIRSITRSILGKKWLAPLLRVSLGVIFIISSLSKLPHQSEFTTTVMSYRILPDALARPLAAVLPFVELFVGCCLVLGLFTQFASALSILMTMGFIVADVWAMARHVEGFRCGCLGNLVNLTHTASLGIDLAMVIAFVGVKSNVVDAAIGEALKANRVVLLFIIPRRPRRHCGRANRTLRY